MAIVNDTIKSVILTLKQRLNQVQDMADMYYRDFKRYEAEVLGLKEAISELENNFKLGENNNGEKAK